MIKILKNFIYILITLFIVVIVIFSFKKNSSPIKEIVINTHYLGEQISEYLKNKKFNININIINEKEKILNTGGGVLNAIKHFSNDFV